MSPENLGILVPWLNKKLGMGTKVNLSGEIGPRFVLELLNLILGKSTKTRLMGSNGVKPSLAGIFELYLRK